MSTIHPYTVKCAVCGRESNQTRITSYSTFGYPDLDFRPPSMFRETMNYWIQECPHCSYVNTSIDVPCDLSKEAIWDLYREVVFGFDWKFPFRYRSILIGRMGMFELFEDYDAADAKGLTTPHWQYETALRFAKLGFMMVKLNNQYGAAKQFLRTAWVFDDGQNKPAATYWRKEAIKQLKPKVDQSLTQVSEKTICVYADMLRRVGDFQSVFKLLEQVRLPLFDINYYAEHYGQLTLDELENLLNSQKELSEQGYRLINYQKKLAERKDRSAHTIDKAKMNEFEVNNQALLQLVDEWEPKLLALPDEVVTYRPNNESWTIKEIVGHLIDSASNNTHRIIHLQYQPSPLIFPNYASQGNNDRWVAIQDYQTENWSDLVQLWKYINRHIVHVIRRINLEKLDNEWISATDEKVSLRAMIVDYLRHVELHLSEINELINIKL